MSPFGRYIVRSEEYCHKYYQSHLEYSERKLVALLVLLVQVHPVNQYNTVKCQILRLSPYKQNIDNVQIKVKLYRKIRA